MAINIRNGKQLVFSVCGQMVKARLRCGQAVKQQKRWSKYFDPGRSCDYSTYGSDHPLKVFTTTREKKSKASAFPGTCPNPNPNPNL